MPDSTATENFKFAVFRSLDAAEREATRRDERIAQLEKLVAHDAGAREGLGFTAERLQALESARIEPERLRRLEEKVTQLSVRSGMLGAVGGAIAGAALEAAFKFLLARAG